MIFGFSGFGGLGCRARALRDAKALKPEIHSPCAAPSGPRSYRTTMTTREMLVGASQMREIMRHLAEQRVELRKP